MQFFSIYIKYAYFFCLEGCQKYKTEGIQWVLFLRGWVADFIENLKRVVQLGVILTLSPTIWGITAIVSIHVWSVRKPWSPLTLCIVSDESWSVFTNDWRIIDCKAEDSRRAVDMWQCMSLDLFCMLRIEVGRLLLCSIFPIIKNIHCCKHFSYILEKTLSKRILLVF